MAGGAGHKQLFDDLLFTLKTGKWNCFILLVASLWTMQMPFYVFSGAFSTPAVPHTCISATPRPTSPRRASTPSQDKPTPYSETITAARDFVSSSYVAQDRIFHYGNNTSLYSNESLECALPGGSPASCTAWAFNTSTYGRTATLEFELVCEKQVFRALYNSIYFFGAIVGSPVSGWMSDRFGRRRVFVMGSTLFALVANILPWMHHLPAILALRFCLGGLHPATVQASYTLVMEVFEARWRAMAGIIVFLPWPLGMMVMAGVCSLVKDWRWQTFYLSLPSLLSLPLFWTVDESPRWLIVRGHHKEAHKTLRKAARWNKTYVPPGDELQALMESIRDQSADSSRGAPSSGDRRFMLWRLFDTFAILFRTRKIRKIALVVYLVFLLTALGYFGLSLSGDLFSSEPFVYMAVSGVVEIPGCTLTIPLVERFGRRLSNVALYFVTGASIICLTFVPSRFESAVMGLALLGKLTIAAAYQVHLLHSSELFPTEVRALGMGTSTMVARIGSTLASFLVGALPSSWSAAPSIVIGCSSLVASGAMLLLPETRGAALYDTVAALEAPRHARDEGEEVRGDDLTHEGEKPVTTIAVTATTTDTTSPCITVITTSSSSFTSSSAANITTAMKQ